MLGTAGFSPTVSLDDNPFEVKRLFEKYGIVPSTVCAHAALLEPSNPGVYGNAEIMKAVQFAAAIGIKDIVTTDTDPRSEWAKNLSYQERTARARRDKPTAPALWREPLLGDGQLAQDRHHEPGGGDDRGRPRPG